MDHNNQVDGFDLDIEVVESGPLLDDVLQLTSDGCGTTCESACGPTCP
ncbi:FxLD family lanthipeptide [Nocardiopsis rhodophaea]